MSHAKFQNHRPSGSEEEEFYLFIHFLYRHGDHLGHVTLTIAQTYIPLFLTMLHIRFSFDCSCGFRAEYV